MKQAHDADALRKAYYLLAAAMVVGIGFDALVFDTGVGLGLSLFIGMIVAGLAAVSRRWGKRLGASAWLLMIPPLFYAAMFSVRESLLLMFLNFVATFLLLFLIAEISTAKQLSQMTIIDFLLVVLVPFRFVRPLRETLDALKPQRPVEAPQRALAHEIARGALLAVPFLLVFTLLFASADVVFADYLGSIFRYEADPEIAARIFLAVLTALIVAGAYSLVMQPQTGQSAWSKWLGPLESKHPLLGQVEVKIFLGSLCSLFLAFILVQVTYLFGGERNIAIPGVTYADYARNGFFQLVAVALLSFAILWSIDHFVELTRQRGLGWFQALSTVMIVEVFVIMLSAFLRLALYESAYGFTTLRLYVHVFIVFLAVVFSLLMHKIVRQRSGAQFALQTLVTMIAFLMGMNLLNPDAFIVRRNAERFATTGKLDANYIASLSSDAAPEVVRSLTGPIRERKGAAADVWMSCLIEGHERRAGMWQATNLARYRAASLRQSYPAAPANCRELLHSE